MMQRNRLTDRWHQTTTDSWIKDSCSVSCSQVCGLRHCVQTTVWRPPEDTVRWGGVQPVWCPQPPGVPQLCGSEGHRLLQRTAQISGHQDVPWQQVRPRDLSWGNYGNQIQLLLPLLAFFQMNSWSLTLGNQWLVLSLLWYFLLSPTVSLIVFSSALGVWKVLEPPPPFCTTCSSTTSCTKTTKWWGRRWG